MSWQSLKISGYSIFDNFLGFISSSLLLCFHRWVLVHQLAILSPIIKIKMSSIDNNQIITFPLFQFWHSAVSAAAVCRTREAVAARSQVLSELIRHDFLKSDLTFQNVSIIYLFLTFLTFIGCVSMVLNRNILLHKW